MCYSFNTPIKIINNVGIYNSFNSLTAKDFAFCVKGHYVVSTALEHFPLV